MRLFFHSFLLFFILNVHFSQQSCKGSPNNLPISTKDPEFVANATNGKLFLAGDVQPRINVLHMYGTPYEMGKAHGTLLKEQIKKLIPEVKEWIFSQVDQYIDFLPQELRRLLEEFGLEAVLEATYLLTKDYTPSYFFEELRGIADGSDMEYMEIVRIHMFPELIKAQCSMFGAWGPSIDNTTGTLYQLRALDWNTDGPFQQFPTVFVYHPKEGDGHPFSILSWSGFIGALTGFSSAPIGVCEKVWITYNGTSSRSGIPFHFLLRDILQFDNDIDDALSRISSAHRTCSIFVGLGDYSHQFRTVEYSYQQINIWDDHNFPIYSAHPRLDGLVYVDKHTQPSHDPCLPSLLQKYYGSIDAETTIRNIAPQHQTGDMHIAVYDFANSFMYVSNASPSPNVIPAYQRPFTRLDMKQLFSEILQ